MAIYNNTIKQRLPSVITVRLNNELVYKLIYKFKRKALNFFGEQTGDDSYSYSVRFGWDEFGQMKKYKYFKSYVMLDDKYLFSPWSNKWQNWNTYYNSKPFDGMFYYYLENIHNISSHPEYEQHLMRAETATLYIEQSNYI